MSKINRHRLGSYYTPGDLALWVAERAVGELPQNQRRLVAFDPACGDGALLRAVRTSNPRIRAIGCDVDARAVAQAQRNRGCKIFKYNPLLPRRGSTVEAHWHDALGGVQPDLFIMNPPWGIHLNGHLERLRKHYALATGQFDSFELFCEGAIRSAKSGAILAFILPDSIFYTEKQKFRQLLLESIHLRLIARLGEGFFEGVFRSTTVIIGKKSTRGGRRYVGCLRLTPKDRVRVLRRLESFESITQKRLHYVDQSRFYEDARKRFDLDVRREEFSTLRKIRVIETTWSDWLRSARGVEISKNGGVAICPRCHCARPLPREGRTALCEGCARAFVINSSNRETIIFAHHDAPHGSRRIIVGEDVDRYRVEPSRMIKPGVAGIDYKPFLHKKRERILVRKTGLGIKAALDYSGNYTTQVVFMYFREDPDVPQFFLYYVLGLLCSRVILAYFLRTHGETEWKSHPYVTQEILNSLPIPTFVQGSWKEKQARAIAETAYAFTQQPERSLAADVFIDCLVAGLFRLSRSDCRWIYSVLNEAEPLQPIRSMRLNSPDLITPHLAA